MPSRSNRQRTTGGEKVRRKFHRCMELFVVEGRSGFYDDESINGIEVPLRYRHIVKQ